MEHFLSFNVNCSKQVIKKAKKGDRFALTQIYHAFKQPVYNLAFHMLRDEHRANDVLQTVMMKMMQSINSLSNPQKLNGWMKRISYNTVIDVIRVNSNFQMVEDDSYFDYSASDTLAVIEKETWDLEYYLSILDDRERLVVWLYSVEGLTHKEIAQRLNVSDQNSRIIFSRAMKSLKQHAKEQFAKEINSGVNYEYS